MSKSHPDYIYDTQSGKAGLGMMSKGTASVVDYSYPRGPVGAAVVIENDNEGKYDLAKRRIVSSSSASSSAAAAAASSPSMSGSSTHYQDQEHGHATDPSTHQSYQQQPPPPYASHHYQPMPATMIKGGSPPMALPLAPARSMSPTPPTPPIPVVPCTALDIRAALADSALTSMRDDLATLELELRRVHGQNCPCAVCADVIHMRSLIPEMEAQFKTTTSELVGVLSSTVHGTKGPGFKRSAAPKAVH